MHSRKERRFRCASSGTPFYRLHKEAGLPSASSPSWPTAALPAVVAAFGLDERVVADWRDKAGSRCQAFHQRRLGTKPLDLGYAKRQGGRSWADCYPSGCSTVDCGPTFPVRYVA